MKKTFVSAFLGLALIPSASAAFADEQKSAPPQQVQQIDASFAVNVAGIDASIAVDTRHDRAKSN